MRCKLVAAKKVALDNDEVRDLTGLDRSKSFLNAEDLCGSERHRPNRGVTRKAMLDGFPRIGKIIGHRRCTARLKSEFHTGRCEFRSTFWHVGPGSKHRKRFRIGIRRRSCQTLRKIEREQYRHIL